MLLAQWQRAVSCPSSHSLTESIPDSRPGPLDPGSAPLDVPDAIRCSAPARAVGAQDIVPIANGHQTPGFSYACSYKKELAKRLDLKDVTLLSRERIVDVFVVCSKSDLREAKRDEKRKDDDEHHGRPAQPWVVFENFRERLIDPKQREGGTSKTSKKYNHRRDGNSPLYDNQADTTLRTHDASFASHHAWEL